jgi:hypothetical protein
MKVTCLFASLLWLVAGCERASQTADLSDAKTTKTEAASAPSGSPRYVTHGGDSPIVLGKGASVVIDGRTHIPIGQRVGAGTVAAETHGNNSPVVIGDGASVTINAK